MDFTIEGCRIPMAFTLLAKKRLIEEFGSPELLQASFQPEDESELAWNMSRIASIMSKAYQRRKIALGKLHGEKDDSFPIEAEDLFSLLDRESCLRLVESITRTVSEANQASVEVVPEKKDEAMPQK